MNNECQVKWTKASGMKTPLLTSFSFNISSDSKIFFGPRFVYAVTVLVSNVLDQCWLLFTI